MIQEFHYDIIAQNNTRTVDVTITPDNVKNLDDTNILDHTRTLDDPKYLVLFPLRKSILHSNIT